MVVRLIGGSIGETTVVNEDDAVEYFEVGKDYILFLNRHKNGHESEYATLVTGKSSVFIFDSVESVSSVDEKYSILYYDMLQILQTK